MKGRLGNFDTRLKTVLEAAKWEKQGYGVFFEFQVKSASGDVSKFADIAVTKLGTKDILRYIQIVKNPLPAREKVAMTFLEKFGKSIHGVVDLIPSN